MSNHIDARIQDALDRAAIEAERHNARRIADQVRRTHEWVKAKDAALRNSGLIQQLGPRGGFEDDYIAEVPLEIGFQYSSEGNVLVFVALGGLDVTKYLPPHVIDEIEHHIQYEGKNP